MKKFISVILLLTVLLSCCACKKEESAAPAASPMDMASPQVLYGHIDQTAPVNGVFQIWSAEGVQNMSK